jgi:hypothetical protein
MEEFDKAFEEFARPNKAEDALKEFSNWILGISFATCAFLITESKDLIGQYCNQHKLLFKFILIVSMLNALISGFNKYFILNRDAALSGKQDILKHIVIQLKLNKIGFDQAKADWDRNMQDWSREFSKMMIIVNVLKFSIISTLITILLTGFYILWTI